MRDKNERKLRLLLLLGIVCFAALSFCRVIHRIPYGTVILFGDETYQDEISYVPMACCVFSAAEVLLLLLGRGLPTGVIGLAVHVLKTAAPMVLYSIMDSGLFRTVYEFNPLGLGMLGVAVLVGLLYAELLRRIVSRKREAAGKGGLRGGKPVVHWLVLAVLLATGGVFAARYYYDFSKLSQMEVTISGTMVMSSRTFSLRYSSGQWIAAYTDARGPAVFEGGGSTVEAYVDEEFAEKVQRILRENRVGTWDGFDGDNPYVFDGSRFSFEARFSNGKTIEAKGYEDSPMRFGKLWSEIRALYGTVLTLE